MEDRADILGQSLPLSHRDALDSEDITKRGVPLTWLETKSVSFFMQFYNDLPNLTHVFDLGAGSAAAAIAAWRSGIYYDGLCENQTHKIWLDNLMNRCMYAVVAQGIGHEKLPGYDRDLQRKVQELFGPQVAEGMQAMCAQGPQVKAKPAKDSADGGEVSGAGENDEDEL